MKRLKVACLVLALGAVLALGTIGCGGGGGGGGGSSTWDSAVWDNGTWN